jgi:hypothetical protein
LFFNNIHRRRPYDLIPARSSASQKTQGTPSNYPYVPCLSREKFALKNILYFKFQIYALILKYGLNGIKMKNRVTGKEPAFSGKGNPSHLKFNPNKGMRSNACKLSRFPFEIYNRLFRLKDP